MKAQSEYKRFKTLDIKRTEGNGVTSVWMFDDLFQTVIVAEWIIITPTLADIKRELQAYIDGQMTSFYALPLTKFAHSCSIK